MVNLSLVGTAPSSILQAAVDYAVAHDVVVVAAAGNYGTDAPGYPAAANGAVAVAAINDADAHPSFSNYGAWVSVSAPGVDVVTTTAGGGYATSTGTSPAAAFGSGVFALLFAANPTMSRSDAIARVQAGAIDLGTHRLGSLLRLGSGRRLRARWCRARSARRRRTARRRRSACSARPRAACLSDMVAIDVAANDNVAIGHVELFVDNRWYATMTAPPYSFVVDASTLPAGGHKLRAYAYDTSNNVAKTKNLKVSFTPGTGLLVTPHGGQGIQRLGQRPVRAARPACRSTPPADDVAVTLTSAGGTILAATAKAGSFAVSGSGKMQGIVAPNVPSTGSVRLTAKSTGDAAALHVQDPRLEPERHDGARPADEPRHRGRRHPAVAEPALPQQGQHPALPVRQRRLSRD